jgi:hypothetical protein
MILNVTKHPVFLFAWILIISLLVLPLTASAGEDPIRVYVDGERIDFSQEPFIEKGTTLVQFRPIFEKLGLDIGWDGATKTVTGTKDQFIMELIIGKETALINGEEHELLAVPRVINGHTMVPIRFVGEATKRLVTWDGDSNSINIKATMASEIHNILNSGFLTYEGAVVNDKEQGIGQWYKSGELWYDGKFVAGQMHGYGMLWINEEVLYQGDFAHDVPHGHGLLFVGNGLAYEGEFADGLRHGAGVEYSPEGYIIEEGIYQKGELIEGKTYKDGVLVYEGQYKNWKFHGIGRLIEDDGYIHEGSFINGMREGQGNIYYPDGENLYFTGEFQSDRMHGKGEVFYINGDLLYSGDIKAGFFHGNGKLYLSNGDVYEGQFRYGLIAGEGYYYDSQGKEFMNSVTLNGEGKYVYSNGNVYIGEFTNGRMHGNGIFYEMNSGRYEGQFVFEKLTGQGTYYFDNGDYKTGQFVNGYSEGEGQYYAADGRLFYDGEFHLNNFEGQGTMYYTDGYFHEGGFKEDLREGYGRFYDPNGNLVEEGIYKADYLVDYMKINNAKIEIYKIVVDGLYENDYNLTSHEAIMFLEITTEAGLKAFKALSEADKKSIMNQYVQENWGDVLGVNVCYTKVVYGEEIYAEADTGYQWSDHKLELQYYPDGKLLE